MKTFMMGLKPTYPMNQVTADLIMNPKPPRLYDIMNAMANYDKVEKTKIRNLAKATHENIFDFEYPLSSKVDKEDFECQILNHYILRRIGFDTFTAFQLYLENKLKEILPFYNKMFDALDDFNLFKDGEVITRERQENGNTTLNSSNDLDSRFSQYPLGRLNDIDSGDYVSTQTANKGNANNTGTSSNTVLETEKRSPIDKMDLYQKYLQTINSIMTMIYRDLDILFYGIED